MGTGVGAGCGGRDKIIKTIFFFNIERILYSY